MRKWIILSLLLIGAAIYAVASTAGLSIAQEDSPIKRIFHTDDNPRSSHAPESAAFLVGKDKYIVLLQDNVISAEWAYSDPPYGLSFVRMYESGWSVYQPIAKGTSLDDVHNATHAYDDGTHWHFTHATPHEHNVLEAVTEALLISHFQPRVNAQNLQVHAGADLTARTLEYNELKYLQALMDDAQDRVEKAVRKLWLGQHIQEGKHDYERETVVAAIRAALTAMEERAKNDPLVRFNLAFVKQEANNVIAELTTTPTYKTRAQIAAETAATSATSTATSTAATSTNPN